MIVAAEPGRRPGPTSPSTDTVEIRPAQADEADALFRLISDNIETGHLLPRPLGEVVLHVPRFEVAVEDSVVIGCAELTRLSPAMAEVRSMVVETDHRGRGIGTRLLTRLIATAVAQDYPRLCAFAHDPRAFLRMGFSIVPHPWLPDKIATDCASCVWFRRCTQYAVMLDLPPGTREARG